jgi:hypothetical protein
MKSLEEMREWLKERIKQDTEWLEHIEGLEKDSEWVQPSSSETEKRIEMYQAILAALSDRTEGPSEEERKETARHFENVAWAARHDPIEICPICEKILALIRGTPAPGKEEK